MFTFTLNLVMEKYKFEDKCLECCGIILIYVESFGLNMCKRLKFLGLSSTSVPSEVGAHSCLKTHFNLITQLTLLWAGAHPKNNLFKNQPTVRVTNLETFWNSIKINNYRGAMAHQCPMRPIWFISFHEFCYLLLSKTLPDRFWR